VLKVTEKKKTKRISKVICLGYTVKLFVQTAKVAIQVPNLTRIVYLLICFCRYVIDSLHRPILNWTPEWEFVSISQFLTPHNQGI